MLLFSYTEKIKIQSVGKVHVVVVVEQSDEGLVSGRITIKVFVNGVKHK